jgi:UDP-N-acetylmuramoyl-tripeptide--D-alanyl-D-alanine ligase
MAGKFRLDAVWMTAMYALIPFYLLLATIPFSLITGLFLQFYQHQAKELIKKHRPVIIGVSGSYGKTSTKYLIAHLLKAQHQVWFSPKSHNTPLSLSRSIALTYNAQPYVVIEYAAYRTGEIAGLAAAYPPSLAVFTGLNDQHLSLFGSHQNMLTAETELFGFLKPNSPLFYNDADKEVKAQVQKFSSQQLIPAASSGITNANLNSGMQLEFNLTPAIRVITGLYGLHYLINICQAVNVARYFQISITQIKAALEAFVPGDEFITGKTLGNGLLVIRDVHSSNPDGFKAAIKLLSQSTRKNKIIVAGGIVDLGSRTSSIHAKLAKQMQPIITGFVHTNTIGKPEFALALGDKYQSSRQFTKLPTPPKETVILIEGKIPADIEAKIYETNL